MKFLCIILLIISFLSGPNIYGQAADKILMPKDERVSQAYGYLIGQEYSLSKIKSKFQNLSLKIEMVQMKFNLTFGNSKEGLRI